MYVITRKTEDGREYYIGTGCWVPYKDDATRYTNAPDAVVAIINARHVDDTTCSRASVMQDKSLAFEIGRTHSGAWLICDWQMIVVGVTETEYHARRYMRTLQSLPTCHDALTDEGAYIWSHHAAEFDDGDAENGPGTDGHDEWDMYEGDYETLIFVRGVLFDRIIRNWEMETFGDTL